VNRLRPGNRLNVVTAQCNHFAGLACFTLSVFDMDLSTCTNNLTGKLFYFHALASALSVHLVAQVFLLRDITASITLTV
jgi:hypothetical protein